MVEKSQSPPRKKILSMTVFTDLENSTGTSNETKKNRSIQQFRTTFSKMSTMYLPIMIFSSSVDILRAIPDFLFAQFVQAENLPVNLRKLQDMVQEDQTENAIVLELFHLLSLFDMAAAAPSTSCNGSFVMNAETYYDFKLAMAAVKQIALMGRVHGDDYTGEKKKFCKRILYDKTAEHWFLSVRTPEISNRYVQFELKFFKKIALHKFLKP